MSELGKVIGQHAPRDRYDDEGHSTGTYCTCGGWTGDYFADGDAGPFDDHLAEVVLAWVAATTPDVMRDLLGRLERAEAARERWRALATEAMDALWPKPTTTNGEWVR